MCPSNKTFIKGAIISLPLIYSISKLACFFAGCCFGLPYDGLFSVTYTSRGNVNISVADTDLKSVTGEIVGGEIHLHNTFDEPENVVVRKYDEVKLLEKGEATLSIPASSVIHLAFEI